VILRQHEGNQTVYQTQTSAGFVFAREALSYRVVVVLSYRIVSYRSVIISEPIRVKTRTTKYHRKKRTVENEKEYERIYERRDGTY
jgi:hypothetical protein